MSIKYVTKRDGSKEAYQPTKILKWELWACEGFKEFIDWRDVIVSVTSKLYDCITTEEIQLKLIEECNNRQTWYYSMVAGRLYTSYISKVIYPDGKPSVKDQHLKMIELGIMVDMGYTDEEYEYIEQNVINHKVDFSYSYGQVKQLTSKYSLRNKNTKIIYETPQFIFIRMAMALSRNQKDKLEKVAKFYKFFSEMKINAPTPNYVNLGTPHDGYISCCLYTTDDTIKSIATGDHIAYTMTYMSSGIGGYMGVRSASDPVKNGLIKHMGKLPYFKALAGAVGANTQNGRGGACTTYFSCYDPEVIDIIHLQNPRTPVSKQNRDIHFAMQFNTFFVEKVYNDEQMFLFNAFTAPDLHAAFFKGDYKHFKEVYGRYEQDDNFKKKYISARDVAIQALRQCHEVATLYMFNVDEVNRHTPFKETIYSSNLCLEIVQPTKPYKDIVDLYTPENKDTSGEISLCALAGIMPSMIQTDDEYEEVAYYTLLMIDECIHMNRYVFPHLQTTALSRMNAGVGMIGLAYDLAKKGYKFNSKEGLEYIHLLSERHMYYLIKGSLRLAKERGVASWMDRTKWVEGWLPIDTYKRDIDEVADFKLRYDWEKLREEVVANKGIRNSVLVAYMPTESCLASDTKVVTSQGEMTLESILLLAGKTLEQASLEKESLLGGTWYDLPDPIEVMTRHGHRSVNRVWYNGQTPYSKITLANGDVIRATQGHKFLVSGLRSPHRYVLVSDIDIGDYVSYKDAKHEVVNIEECDADSTHFIDIEVDDLHEYILSTGCVSHNSSKATGLPNGVYPVRDIFLKKTDGSNAIDFVVMESDLYAQNYQIAWDLTAEDMAKVYGVIQKFTDQSISADFYKDRTGNKPLKSSELLLELFYMYKYGVKTRYYTNSKTTKGLTLDSIEMEDDVGQGCAGGFCTL